MTEENKTARLIDIRDNVKDITKIAERTQKVLAANHKINISHWQAIPTMVYEFLRESVNYIARNKTTDGISLALANVLTLGISYRENEDAEKEGNYTPFVTINNDFVGYSSVLATDDGSKAAKLIELGANAAEIIKIAETTQTILASTRKINISHWQAIPTMYYVFVTEAISHLATLAAPGVEPHLNLMQLIDIGYNEATEGEANSLFAMPGQEFKLLVKDDGSTEQ